ncbi:uncharacterized protein [Palaemon carinicauda]|uniref:uncharacterized protein n=1 Tax=Palaemon carinicauda TaxID=392227 RepID=UPI0035B63FBB
MPSSCCALGCKNRHVPGTSKRFFRFPKSDLERRKRWVQAIGRLHWEPNGGSRICSDHFVFGEKSDDKDSPNYIPSIFTHKCTQDKKRLNKIYGRTANRKPGQKLANTAEVFPGASSNKDGSSSSDQLSKVVSASKQLSNTSSSPKIIGSDSDLNCNPSFMEPETLLYCLEESDNNSIDNTNLDCQKGSKILKTGVKTPKGRPRRARKARYDADYVELDELFCSEEEDTDSAPEIQGFLMRAESVSDQSTQTILQYTYIQNLEDECYNLRCELSRIKGKYMFKDMELEMFKDNDEKVKYLTGLENYNMLKALSDIISEYQRHLVRLSSFQQLMVTLMKIKLNLPMKFFGVLFNVNLTGISRLFNETIDLLFKKLVPLCIVWPNREDMRKILPSELNDCQNCVYITDTFDLQVDLSSGSSSTFNKVDGGSSLDLNTTSKGQTVRRFLMTIAPQGSVIFISKGVLGEVSDRTLALESGFFENITPGDVILTEKELGIDDAVAVMGATLRSSNSIKSQGKAVMNNGEGDNPRLVRIKRAIQLLKKKYTILDNKIPINWVKVSEKETHTTLDKIVHIVCALSNMANRVWSYEKYLPAKTQSVTS